MGIIKRMKDPTPRFFRIIRNIGLAAATIGGSLIAAPFQLPEVMDSAASYLAVAGTVASAISQAVTTPTQEELWEQEINQKKKKR